MTVRNFCIVSLLFPLISCQEDEIHTPELEINNASFSIVENSKRFTEVGSIEILNNEGQNLNFSLLSNEILPFEINKSTGKIYVEHPILLDYETKSEFFFKVKVSEENKVATANISVEVQDEEDGNLTNLELSRIDHFLSISIPYEEAPLAKWTKPANVYVHGENILFSEKAEVLKAIETLNGEFSDGFYMTMVDKHQSYDIEVFIGSESELEAYWPDIHEFAVKNSASGYAIAEYTDNFEIINARVYVNRGSTYIIYHELGHALGFYHPENCRPAYPLNQHPTVMCPSPDRNSIFIDNEFDRFAIQIMYCSDLKPGMKKAEIDRLLRVK